MAERIRIDQGQQEVDQTLIEIFRDQFKADISGHHLLETPIKAWHAAATVWYRILVLAIVIWLVTFASCLQFWREMAFLGICTIGLLGIDCLVVTEAEVRYLHSLAWLVILLIAVLMVQVARIFSVPTICAQSSRHPSAM